MDIKPALQNDAFKVTYSSKPFIETLLTGFESLFIVIPRSWISFRLRGWFESTAPGSAVRAWAPEGPQGSPRAPDVRGHLPVHTSKLIGDRC